MFWRESRRLFPAWPLLKPMLSGLAISGARRSAAINRPGSRRSRGDRPMWITNLTLDSLRV
jgi:hypothetical protein